MRMMSIASGSSGNCIYIGTDNTHILVDTGISKKKVLEGLNKLDLKAEDIDAVLITHEHDDHIKGLGVFLRHCATPVYSSEGVIKYLSGCEHLGKLPKDVFHSFTTGNTFKIKDLTVNTVKVSHDAVDPVAYTFSDGRKKAGIITDLGEYEDSTLEAFKNLDTMLIESNHDINMLLNGPYPYSLKQRILGRKGHLSNEMCGRMLGEILNDKVERVILGHLSRENNFPELAHATVRAEINMGDNRFNADDFDIQVAPRQCPSDIITI